MDKVLYEKRKRISFLTDSDELNAALGGRGIESGNLFIVQGPTGSGKTTFLMRLAILAAKEHKVTYISLCGEQPLEELSSRLAKMIRGKPYHGYFAEDYTEEELQEEEEDLAQKTSWKNIEIVYEKNDPLTTLDKAVERGAEVIVIDYLGSLNTEIQEQMYSFLTSVAIALKDRATEKNIIIITAMQTNRNLDLELKNNDVDPLTVDGSFMADSIGPARIGTICLSWFKYRGKRYLTLYKNRFNGEKVCIEMRVEPKTYRWIDVENVEAGF